MQGMETDNMLWQDNAGKGMGHVFLVGAGPGRRDLITVQGLELLRGCDVVVYDRLSGEELLGEVKDGCEQIDVGKGAGHGARQDEINELLVRKAKEGLQVVRLKGGDPFVFGRGRVSSGCPGSLYRCAGCEQCRCSAGAGRYPGDAQKHEPVLSCDNRAYNGSDPGRAGGVFAQPDSGP